MKSEATEEHDQQEVATRVFILRETYAMKKVRFNITSNAYNHVSGSIQEVQDI